MKIFKHIVIQMKRAVIYKDLDRRKSHLDYHFKNKNKDEIHLIRKRDSLLNIYRKILRHCFIYTIIHTSSNIDPTFAETSRTGTNFSSIPKILKSDYISKVPDYIGTANDDQ